MSEKKVALITGAAGGLGRSLAGHLEAEGWSLVVASRDADRLSDVFGERHLQVCADCGSPEGAKEIFQVAQENGLVPQAFAHCVGNIKLGALHRLSEADYQESIQANLSSAFHSLAAFVGNLRQHNLPGSAVLVSSVAAQMGTPNHEAVAAAKGGVEGLARGAAATYAPYGIRVNVVAPGIMDSPATERLLATDASRSAAARQYPLPGIGSTTELAELMAWLMSDRSSRVTAQVWSVDGGFTGVRPVVK
ncbi:MAG: SDR family oxidoreductase [Rhodocyclaceae bacterium]|nr:SDR family oxidoreductase [Rhodocyclaceae bacterium]